MKRLVLVIFLFISGHILFAQNANDALRLGIPGLGFSARALGMGNAYIGLSDDNGAAFFNPAGFGLMRKMEFSGGLDYSRYNNDTKFFNSASTGTNSETRLDNLSFSFPFPTMRGSLVFALSYHNTKDFTGAQSFDAFNNSSSYIGYLTQTSSNPTYNIPFDLWLSDTLGGQLTTPLTRGLKQSGNTLNSGSLNNWTISGAIEIYRNLFVGLNVNIISGTFESNNDYYEDDINNLYQGENAIGNPGTTDFKTFYLNRITNWDISGWDAKVGMLYQFNRFSRFGFTVQFPKTYSIDEKFNVEGYSQFANKRYDINSADYSDQVKYDIVTPFEIGAGFSLNFRGLILSAQGTLIDYSQLKFDSPDGLSDQYIGTVNKDIKDRLTGVFNYNVGAEYTIPQIGLRLRGGFMVQPSAFKGDPSDFDRKYLTAGLGFLADETVGIDLGYAHGWWKDLGDNYGVNLSRTFQTITSDKFILTASYRF